MKTVLEVLKIARKRLASEKNWCKGSFHVHKGGIHAYCLLGACGYRFETDPEIGDFDKAGIHTALVDAIRYVFSSTFSVTAFNDNKKRTYTDIIRVLDYAITVESAPRLGDVDGYYSGTLEGAELL